MKATLKDITTRITEQEIEHPGSPVAGDIIRTTEKEIELPDNYNTGDIISVVANAMKKFYYDDCIGRDTFEIAVEDGYVYHCYEVVINKYRLYVDYIDEDGEEHYCIADFML